jgi:hypothetical protein
VGQEVTFELVRFEHLEALRDAVDEILTVAGDVNSAGELLQVLRDERGWQNAERHAPSFLVDQPNVFSIRKLWTASSMKYFMVEVIDWDGACRVRIKYAGGIPD